MEEEFSSYIILKFVAFLQSKKCIEFIIPLNEYATGSILVDCVTAAILLSKEIAPLLGVIIIVNCRVEVWEIEGKYAAIAHI